MQFRRSLYSEGVKSSHICFWPKLPSEGILHTNEIMMNFWLSFGESYFDPSASVQKLAILIFEKSNG